jgi:hypothetical protein
MESAFPQAVIIWSILLVIVVVAATGLLLPDRPAAAESENDPVTDAARYADEMVVAADRAAATAARRRAEWQDATATVADAWADYEAADRAARRFVAASAYPMVCRRRRPGDNAERQRHLHRTATAACRRREISIAQLNDALAHRGWDPRQHPVAQEATLHTAIRAHRLAAYRLATERERAAWETAELAATALRSLRAEALAAQTQAPAPTDEQQWWAQQWDDATVPLRPIRPATAGVPIRSTVDSRHPIAA